MTTVLPTPLRWIALFSATSFPVFSIPVFLFSGPPEMAVDCADLSDPRGGSARCPLPHPIQPPVYDVLMEFSL